jgi:hypothetical protein
MKIDLGLLSAAIFFAGLLLAYVYRATFPPYAIIFSCLFLSGLLFARSIKRAGWVVHNLAFVFLALAMAELYFDYNEFDTSTLHQHHIDSQNSLGYVASAGTFRAVETYGFGTRVVYDVHYSIDKNGLRIAPDSLKQNGPTVMFFGDSFTFGEGVNDEDTLPNAFSIVSGMRVLNFGVGGYGPHHMLRLLELGDPKKVTSESPYLMVYTALEEHFNRAAGRAVWDKFGPLYEVQNGRAHYVGPFNEHNMGCNPNAIKPSVIGQFLQRSGIWRAYILSFSFYCPAPNDPNTVNRDRTRFLEILKSANLIAHQDYHSRLLVILWDIRPKGDVANINWVEAKLLENNIPTLKLSSAIKEADFKNWIIERDSHPNPKAYRAVAQTLLSWIKKNPNIVASPQ